MLAVDRVLNSGAPEYQYNITFWSGHNNFKDNIWHLRKQDILAAQAMRADVNVVLAEMVLQTV